jgi:alpha-amylase
VPTVYARDWDELGMAASLRKLIQARRYYAYGSGHEHAGNTAEVYAYVREGLAGVPGTGLVLMLSGRNSGGTVTFAVNSRQPSTEFYDFTGNVSGAVMTDSSGTGNFTVNRTENSGWSVWVPVH